MRDGGRSGLQERLPGMTFRPSLGGEEPSPGRLNVARGMKE